MPDREEPELEIVFLTKLDATIYAAMMSQLTNDASRGTPSGQNMSCTYGSDEASQNWVCKIEAYQYWPLLAKGKGNQEEVIIEHLRTK